jgi:hypothetical protein
MTETCEACGVTRFSWDGGHHQCGEAGELLSLRGSHPVFWNQRFAEDGWGATQ